MEAALFHAKIEVGVAGKSQEMVVPGFATKVDSDAHFFAKYNNYKQYNLLNTYKKYTTSYADEIGLGQNKAKPAQQHSPREQKVKQAQIQTQEILTVYEKESVCKNCSLKKVLSKTTEFILVPKPNSAFIAKLDSRT